MKNLIGKTTALSNLKDIEMAEKNAANFIKGFLMESLIGKITALSNLKDIEKVDKNAVNFIKSFFKENFSDIKIKDLIEIFKYEVAMKNLIEKTTALSNLKDIERAEKNAANFIKGFLMERLIGKTTILSNLKDIEKADKNAVNFIKSFFKENFSDIKILRSTKEGDFVFSKVTMIDSEVHFLKSKTDIKKMILDYKITVSISLVDLEEVPKRLLK